jgi:hypothetical protein
MTVLNPAPDAKKVSVYVNDWKYLPVQDGTKDFQPPSTFKLSAAKWITFLPAEFTIPAFGKVVLNYTVRVPEDAKGGYYAVLFFENYLGGEQVGAEGVNVNLAIRVACLFYVEAKGTVERTVVIDNLRFNKQQERFCLSADFSNTGNVDITAKSDFYIIDDKGMVYARGDFNDVYTLPQDTAKISSCWKEIVPAGTYDLVMTIDIGRALKELRMGEIPALTKETQIEIGGSGEVTRIGELK